LEPVVAFDVGNTCLKGAVLRGGRCEALFAIPTAPLESLGERLAESLTACADSIPTGPRRWVASSVCPEADRVLAQDCLRRGVPGPEMFGRDLPVPIPALVREPGRVGTDRLLCALGARAILGAPCIAVGAGTAITVDLVDAEGRFAGGAIAPGLRLSAWALHEGTSLLPLVEPSVPERAVGLDTVEAVRIGVHTFCRAGVAELVRLLSAEAGRGPVPVALTGGDATALLPLPANAQVRHVPELIFLGMAEALRGG